MKEGSIEASIMGSNYRSKGTIVLLCVGIAVIGLFGHLYGNAKGFGGFYASAWDEETYGLVYLAGDVPMNRMFGYGIFRLFEELFHSGERIWVCFDIFFPVIAFLSAIILSRSICGVKSSWHIVSALGFLIAPPVFCFGYNLTFWTSKSSVLYWGDLLPDAVKAVVPWTHTMTYNPYFRTPEPQISAVLLLIAICLLVRSVWIGRNSKLVLFGVCVMGMVITTGYLFCSIPVLCFAAMIVGIGIILRLPFRDLLGSVLFLLGFLVTLAVISVCSSGVSGASLIFASRLPVVSPLVIICLIAIASEILLARKDLKGNRVVVLVLAAFLVPIILQNQQIITGKMVIPGKWETFGGPLFFYLGLFLSIAKGELGKVVGRVFRFEFSPALIGLFAFSILVLTQYRSVMMFELANRQASGLARRIADLPKSGNTNLPFRVVLSSPYMQTPVQFRLTEKVEFVYGYLTTVIEFPIERVEDVSTYRRSVQEAFPAVFEYIARMGWEVVDLRSELISIAEGSGGFLALALFSPLDVWAPFSEGRAVQLDAVNGQIDWIVNSYSQYLESDSPEWKKETYVVLFGESEVPSWNPIWDTVHVSDEEIDGVEISIFRQKRRDVSEQSTDSI